MSHWNANPATRAFAASCGIALVSIALVFLAPSAAAAGERGTTGLECRVVLQPDALPSQQDAVELQVLLPGQVGDALSGEAETGSGIGVLSVGTEDSGVTLVTLDTSAAVVGDWIIRFRAEDGTCGGRLTIADES